MKDKHNVTHDCKVEDILSIYIFLKIEVSFRSLLILMTSLEKSKSESFRIWLHCCASYMFTGVILLDVKPQLDYSLHQIFNQFLTRSVLYLVSSVFPTTLNSFIVADGEWGASPQHDAPTTTFQMRVEVMCSQVSSHTLFCKLQDHYIPHLFCVCCMTLMRMSQGFLFPSFL